MELHRPSGRRGLGLAYASTTMLLWGVLPLALREALRSLDPATLTAFRFAVSAGVLGVALAARGALPQRAQLTRGTGTLLAVATLGLAANYIAFLLGLARTSPANAQVLIQAGPLLLALGGIAVFRERFSASQWIGAALLALGLGLFFRSQLAAMGREPARYLAGVAWIGFAAATWAIYGLAQKQLLHGISSQAVMLCIFAGCALVFLPASSPRALLALTPARVGRAGLLHREHARRLRCVRGGARARGGVARVGGDRAHAARDRRDLGARERALPASLRRRAPLGRELDRRGGGRRRIAADGARAASSNLVGGPNPWPCVKAAARDGLRRMASMREPAASSSMFVPMFCDWFFDRAALDTRLPIHLAGVSGETGAVGFRRSGAAEVIARGLAASHSFEAPCRCARAILAVARSAAFVRVLR